MPAPMKRTIVSLSFWPLAPFLYYELNNAALHHFAFASVAFRIIPYISRTALLILRTVTMSLPRFAFTLAFFLTHRFDTCISLHDFIFIPLPYSLYRACLSASNDLFPLHSRSEGSVLVVPSPSYFLYPRILTLPLLIHLPYISLTYLAPL